MKLKIAIVDSGVNALHSHVSGVAGGVGLGIASDGSIYEHSDIRDQLGHGTAIAGVIREKLPEAHLYAVRIFYHELNAPIALLEEALRWAIEKEMNVIHLSLGTTRDENRPVLETLCRQAHAQGKIVIAAARAPDDPIYPAAFETVIGAYWHKRCKPHELVFHADTPIEFGAFGRPREIPGLAQERNFGGASFAAARVTAMAAGFLQQDTTADMPRIRDLMKLSAKGDA